MTAQRVAYGLVGTHRQAVEADHAAAHVCNMVVEIYALGLACIGAFAALDAAVGIDVDMEGGVARKESQRRRQGA